MPLLEFQQIELTFFFHSHCHFPQWRHAAVLLSLYCFWEAKARKCFLSLWIFQDYASCFSFVGFIFYLCVYIYACAHVCVVGSQVHVCKCMWRPEFSLNYCFLGAIYLDFEVESLTRTCRMQFYEAGWPPSPIELSVPIFQALRLQSCDSTPGLFHDS